MPESGEQVSAEDMQGSGLRRSTSRLFDFTINVSHIVTAMFVLGSVAWFVITLRDDIRTTGADLRQMIVELRAENKIQDQAIAQLRVEQTTRVAEEVTFRSEMRQSTTEFQKLLMDIRLQAARQEKK